MIFSAMRTREIARMVTEDQKTRFQYQFGCSTPVGHEDGCLEWKNELHCLPPRWHPIIPLDTEKLREIMGKLQEITGCQRRENLHIFNFPDFNLLRDTQSVFDRWSKVQRTCVY